MQPYIDVFLVHSLMTSVLLTVNSVL